MTKLELKGWRPGVQTVSLIQAMKQYSATSLGAAKQDVERLLSGEIVLLEFETEELKEKFRLVAEPLGVIIEDEPSRVS